MQGFWVQLLDIYWLGRGVENDYKTILFSTGKPKANGKKLVNIRVPLPPLPDQRRIVAFLDALQAKMDALRRLQAETGAELDALLPAVLDKAFKGEM